MRVVNDRRVPHQCKLSQALFAQQAVLSAAFFKGRPPPPSEKVLVGLLVIVRASAAVPIPQRWRRRY